MTDFNYKKYSLEQLDNWMHDCMSSGEATPQEIYDVIKSVVEENYYTYKQQTAKAYELLALLNGNGKGHIKAYDDCVDKVLSCDKDDPSPECKGAWNDFWKDVDDDVRNDIQENGYDWTPVPPHQKYVGWQNVNSNEFNKMFPNPSKDKVVKWVLPVSVDGLTGECYVNLPDDLLERAGLVEGDMVEWVDRGDGSFEMRKVNGTK